MRQASRAVPAEYRRNGGQMPSSMVESTPDVLEEQNAIPESGRPVRTRPSIPNYQPRVTPEDLEASFVLENEQASTPVDADISDVVEVEADAASHKAADVLHDGAAKVGEAGSALIEGIQQSETAAKAKELAAGVPGVVAATAKRASAALHEEDGTLRKKPIGIAAAVVAYLVIAVYFCFHYYPMTTIGPVGVGGMDTAQAAQAIEQAATGYELKVEGENDVSFTVKASEAGLSLDTQQIARSTMDADTGFLWPIYVFLPHDHSDVLAASAAASGFREVIADAVAYYNEDAVAPTDATISYDKAQKTFVVVPETLGNTLDEEKIAEHVVEALAAMEPTLTLGPDDYVQPKVFQDDARLAKALEQAQTALQTNVTFTAHGSNVDTLDGETAASMVMTDENVQMVLDEDQVNEWVQKLAEKCSTVGVKRTWTREDGEKCTVEGGVYGWEADWLAVDEALHDAIANGTIGSVEVPMAQEGAAYNGTHGRDWKSYIDVDLDEQHAVYYDDKGKVLWEADFVSGSPDGEHDTPQGVYYINNKESPSTLLGDSSATGSPEYRTVVQYWMPWEENSVGFHDAEWQDEFGGSRYEEGFGSHGCINLSIDDAASLYKIADIGTVVVCHGSDHKASKKTEDEGEE
ncbi:MAG: L,D-transpeptidase family protein [Coriobacteriia bacterium]|nr:L,D-transpeptidase family protein [Coriobacteriia bacterium]